MGTRATIKFQDGDEVYFVYRGHDGFPDNVLADIKDAIEKSKNRWSNPELGCLVTLFLAMNYDYEKARLPYYDLTPSFHGDESYRYYCKWDEKEWKFGIITS